MRVRGGAVLVGLLVFVSGGRAQTPPIASFEAITVSTTAVGIATATLGTGPTQTTACLASVKTNAINYRFDGTNPTATEGVPLAVTQTVTILGIKYLKDFKMIASGADASVKVHCWQ